MKNIFKIFNPIYHMQNHKKHVKKARMRAHAYFDLLWKSGLMTRSQAYGRLKQLLNITNPNGAHIKQFNQSQCEKLINLLKQNYPDLYRNKEYLDSFLFYS